MDDLQYMGVKVIYTLNDKDQSPCLHRLQHAQPITVVTLDDGSRLGAVDLKTCVDEVLKASPELLPKLKEHDHAVYAYDYSEEDIPTVGQGKLSAILNSDSLDEDAKQIVGRIIKNPMAAFKKQSAETLEVKLKFVALPSDSPLKKKAPRPQLLDTSSGTNTFASRMQAAYDRPVRSSPQLPMSSSPAYIPDDFSLYQENTNSPGSMSQQEFNMFLNSPIPSPTLSKAGVAIDLPQHMQSSRPPSRLSNQAPTPPLTSTGLDLHDIEQVDDGPARKRARLEQAPRPRSASAFGTHPRDAPLRRTASTTASIRHFRPQLNGAAPQETGNGNRLPTPRPQRTRDAAPRRMSSMSMLRQAESFDDSVASSPPVMSPEDPSSAFTSSPPLRPFEVYDDGQHEGQQDEFASCSSPLPPLDNFDENALALDDFDMGFSDLPDVPTSEWDPHVDISLGSGPVQDSAINMPSEDQLPHKVPTPMQRQPSQSSMHQGTAAPDYHESHSRRGSSSVPNQKTQKEFATGEHPLYQQRSTRIAWNSYAPQGAAPALYVQTKPADSGKKAASAIGLRNKPSKLSRHPSTTPMPMSSTPAPSSPMLAPQPLHPQQPPLQMQGQMAWSPTESLTSPAETIEVQQPQALQMPPQPQMTAPLTAPTPPEIAAPGHKSKKTSPSRGRAALGEVSGNASKVAIPRVTTPKPTAAPTAQSWTPGSKKDINKRKREASKAPTKTTRKSKDSTPSGRAEKKTKLAPKPMTNENGERLYCIACGAIESNTWRNLFSKCFPGPHSPAPHFEHEDKVHIHPNVDASGQPDRNEKGEVRWYTVHKKSLTQQETESGDWHLQKQCNPCGVYFNMHGKLKSPDWKELGAKDGFVVKEDGNGAADSPPEGPQQHQHQEHHHQQQPENGTEGHYEDVPIDLTASDRGNDVHHRNLTAVSDGGQFDDLFSEEVENEAQLQHSSSTQSIAFDHQPISRQTSTVSLAEKPQLQHQTSNDSLLSNSESDKENMPPPLHMGEMQSDPAHAFHDLPNGEETNTMQMGGQEQGEGEEEMGESFDDLWTRGLDELVWPGEMPGQQIEAGEA